LYRESRDRILYTCVCVCVLGFHTGRCSPFSPGPEKLLQSSRTARRLPLLLTTYAPSRVKIFKNKDRPALVKIFFFFQRTGERFYPAILFKNRVFFFSFFRLLDLDFTLHFFSRCCCCSPPSSSISSSCC
jgi:hypothetical protein